MQWGTEKEPDARAAYEFRSDVEVSQVGIVLHSTIAGTHASPDGLVGNDGLIEIKCPGTATHVETLLGDEIPGKYVTQMQWQMACTGRAWCDFVSFDPRMPESMALFIKRVQRDDVRIAELELEARKFLAELEAKVSDLRTRYERRAAA
jgi:predicted phage-related endonuclease